MLNETDSNNIKSDSTSIGNSSNKSSRNDTNKAAKINHSAVHKPVPGKDRKGKLWKK